MPYFSLQTIETHNTQVPTYWCERGKVTACAIYQANAALSLREVARIAFEQTAQLHLVGAGAKAFRRGCLEAYNCLKYKQL